MDAIHDFLNWAWARHHNPISWYIRPLFILPYCYFAYKKSKWGVALTIVAVLSSMFWFPAPETTDPRAAEFLAMEQQYITGSWTFSKVVMTALVPVWFIALAWAFWWRSWLAGFLVINMGALLKVIWSFYFGGASAWGHHSGRQSGSPGDQRRNAVCVSANSPASRGFADSAYLTSACTWRGHPTWSRRNMFNLKYFEVRKLEFRFGQSYMEYKRRVPFLLPRLKHT